jgi:hypothetical protein
LPFLPLFDFGSDTFSARMPNSSQFTARGNVTFRVLGGKSGKIWQRSGKVGGKNGKVRMGFSQLHATGVTAARSEDVRLRRFMRLFRC